MIIATRTEQLETAIAALLAEFEAETQMEVGGWYRSMDKDAVTVTLTRKKVVVEKVEETPGF